MTQNTINPTSVYALIITSTGFKGLPVAHVAGRNTFVCSARKDGAVTYVVVDHYLPVERCADFEEARRTAYKLNQLSLHGRMLKVEGRFVPEFDLRSLTALGNIIGAANFHRFEGYHKDLLAPSKVEKAIEEAIAEVAAAPEAPRRPRRSKKDVKAVAPAFPAVENGHVVTVSAEFGY